MVVEYFNSHIFDKVNSEWNIAIENNDFTRLKSYCETMITSLPEDINKVEVSLDSINLFWFIDKSDQSIYFKKQCTDVKNILFRILNLSEITDINEYKDDIDDVKELWIRYNCKVVNKERWFISSYDEIDLKALKKANIKMYEMLLNPDKSDLTLYYDICGFDYAIKLNSSIEGLQLPINIKNSNQEIYMAYMLID